MLRPTATANIHAPAAILRVIPKCSRMISLTGLREPSDCPMSNCIRFHIQVRYWSGNGLSKPRCRLISAICSSLNSTCASPIYKIVGSGPSLLRMKMTTVAPIMEMNIDSALLARNRAIAGWNLSAGGRIVVDSFDKSQITASVPEYRLQNEYTQAREGIYPLPRAYWAA